MKNVLPASTLRCELPTTLTVFLLVAALLPMSAQIVPPEITVQPTNQTVLASHMATFTVSATGSPPLHYQWYWNGIALVGANTNTLAFTAVPFLAGSYYAIVCNLADCATSSVVVLTVLTDPSIVSQPTNQDAVIGDDVTFNVVAAGTAPLSYQWFLNSVPLEDQTTDTLLLTNVTLADSGVYRVAVTNIFGSITSAPAALSVLAEVRRIKSFNNSVDGEMPFAPLIEGSDGWLYGTTVIGGSAGQGTIFKLAKDGGQFTVLRTFTTASTDGRQSRGILVEGADGVLYGTTTYGGSADQGVVFKIQKDGTGFALLHSFGATAFDGSQPVAGLMQGSDQALYGTTLSGGDHGFGTVFKLNANGAGYVVLHSFYDGSDLGEINEGRHPEATLLEGSDGVLYGTTRGDEFWEGSVFKLNKNGTGFAVLRRFGNGANRYSKAPLIEGSDGALYGTTYGGPGEVFKISMTGLNYTVLRSFSGFDGDAAKPHGALLEGPDGILYGTTREGGSVGVGAIFKLSHDGSGYRLVYSFTGSDAGGAYPTGALRLASDGAFYVTTSAGGDTASGTIYRIRTTPPSRPAPRVTSLSRAGADLLLTGSNGAAGDLCQVLMSTNLEEPLDQWTPIATNMFDATGSFSLTMTNAVNPAAPQRFYILQLQ